MLSDLRAFAFKSYTVHILKLSTLVRLSCALNITKEFEVSTPNSNIFAAVSNTAMVESVLCLVLPTASGKRGGNAMPRRS